MTTNLTDLLGTDTAENILDSMIALARMAGFPTAAWQPMSVLRTLFEREAQQLADLRTMISGIARGAFRTQAKGGWLDLIASEFFGDARKPAVSAVFQVTLSDAAAAGPFVIAANSLWIADATRSRRYLVTDAVTVPLNGTATAAVKAESPGAYWNVASAQVTELVTPMAGLHVTNTDANMAVSWAVLGADAETDEVCSARLGDKWGQIDGVTQAAFRSWALNADPTVRKVVVTQSSGAVTVTLAQSAATVSNAARAAVDAVLVAKAPICCVVTTVAAAELAMPFTLVAYYPKGSDPTNAQAAVTQAVLAAISEYPIGGDDRSWAWIIAAAKGAAGVTDVVLTSAYAGPGKTPATVYTMPAGTWLSMVAR